MKYFYPNLHNLHQPSIDLSDGLPAYDHLERAERIDLVLSGLQKAYPAKVVYTDDLAVKEVQEIHDPDYIDFLMKISNMLEGSREYLPSIFRDNMEKAPLFFQGGMYCKEIGTPIGRGSIRAALNSAQATLEAADYMITDQASAFVLTRPPGHHAGKRRYGGYCFFNNPYLAANFFVKKRQKAVVVDIDYHIGDGSLEFAGKEMPYFSLHADPHKNYPYLESTLHHHNTAVRLKEFKTGISGDQFIAEIRFLLEDVKKQNADVVVLSLGFDTLETDYCQDEYIYVKPDNFKEIGALFGRLPQNVLILLEGGYDMENIEKCSEYFMQGFMHEKRVTVA